MQKISIINDEVGNSIQEAVSFVKVHGVKYLEIRMINGANLANMSISQIKKCATYLKKNNIKVSGIASPLLKWYPKDVGIKKYEDLRVDEFCFDVDDLFTHEKIFQIAEIFNTKYIRIFSFLKYRNFKMEHLDLVIEGLLKLAKRYNKILLLENEPVCNINTIGGLVDFIKRYNSPNFKILFDPGNLYKQGGQINYDELIKIKEYVDYIHVKDFCKIENEYSILGKGNINYKKLASFFEDKRGLVYSMETHTGKNKKNDSSNSIKKLTEILTEKRVKYGIVGCGRIFNKHVFSVEKDKNSELIGVFDIDKKRMLEKAQKHDCSYYSDLDQLIDQVDVVNICTPHNTHSQIIKKVLQHGKKCLCEKPGCMSVKEAESIKRIKKYKNNLFVVFQNRFNQPLLKLNDLYNKKQLGKLLYVCGSVRWFRDKSYYTNTWRGKKELEGGMLFNQGIHTIDILMKYFKPSQRVKIMSAFRGKIYHKKIETEDLFLAHFKSGDTVFNLELMTSSIPSNLENNILFVFEGGRIEIKGLSMNESLGMELIYNNVKQKFNYDMKSDDVYGSGHQNVIKVFSRYVLTGEKDSNLVGFDEVCARISFVERLYKQTHKIK